MKYLIVSEIIAQIDGKHIVGLAENKLEIFSLLTDFYNFIKSSDKSFESSWLPYFNISIYKISDKDYLEIIDMFDKYSDIIGELKWKYTHIENFFDNFIFVPLEYSESEDDVFLTNTEINDINNIIERSETLLI